MKYIVILLLLLAPSISQAQNEPIAISADGVWIEASGSFDPFGNFIYNSPTGLAISDTVNVNDTLYLQFSGVDHCTDGTQFVETFLLREDAGKYFYRQSEFTPEKLWFDFTLEMGETIFLEHCYPEAEELEQLTVIEIQLITLSDGSQRNKWTLQYSDNQSGSYLMTEEWIEGIGNVQQGFRHPTAQTCVDIGHWLRCYYENDNWVESFEFIVPGTTCCNIVDVHELIQKNIVLYPNPSSGVLNLESHLPIATIEIIDNSGRLIMKQHSNGTRSSLNIESLAPGCYFLTATTVYGTIETLKFLRE